MISYFYNVWCKKSHIFWHRYNICWLYNGTFFGLPVIFCSHIISEPHNWKLRQSHHTSGTPGLINTTSCPKPLALFFSWHEAFPGNASFLRHHSYILKHRQRNCPPLFNRCYNLDSQIHTEQRKSKLCFQEGLYEHKAKCGVIVFLIAGVHIMTCILFFSSPGQAEWVLSPSTRVLLILPFFWFPYVLIADQRPTSVIFTQNPLSWHPCTVAGHTTFLLYCPLFNLENP